MKDKNKKLLMYGGAAAAVLFIATRGGGAGGWGGGFGGVGAGSEGSGGLAETVAAVTAPIADVVPFIGAPETYVGTEEFKKDVETGIFGDIEFYKVGSITPEEQSMRRAEIGQARLDRTKKESMTADVKSDVKLPGVTGAGLWDKLFGIIGISGTETATFMQSKRLTPSTFKSKDISATYKGSTPIRYSGAIPSMTSTVKKSSSGGGTYPAGFHTATKPSEYTGAKQYKKLAAQGIFG